ncbi:hypothetical protein FOXYSP1_19779 [Fusarium oxysporum f. sp. phaseoli]
MICGALGYLLFYEYGLARFSYKYAKGGVKVASLYNSISDSNNCERFVSCG